MLPCPNTFIYKSLHQLPNSKFSVKRTWSMPGTSILGDSECQQNFYLMRIMKTRKWTSWILLRWPLQLELPIFNWSIVSHWCDIIGKKRSPPAREKVKFRKQGDCEKSHWRWAKICSELKREQHNEYCQGSYESNGENCSKEKSCQKDQRRENMWCTDILITMCLIINHHNPVFIYGSNIHRPKVYYCFIYICARCQTGN